MPWSVTPCRLAPIMARASSVRKAARGREGVETVVAQHVRRERARAEYSRKGPVSHAQPARIDTEGRHHQRHSVACEATPADRAAALHDARDRVQMPCNFAGWGVGRWLVAELECTDDKRRAERSADAFGGIGIVIAGDPDPIAPALQYREGGAILRREP